VTKFEGPRSNRLGAIKFAHTRYDGDDGVTCLMPLRPNQLCWLGRKNCTIGLLLVLLYIINLSLAGHVVDVVLRVILEHSNVDIGYFSTLVVTVLVDHTFNIGLA